MRIKTRAYALKVMLLRFIDSLVNRLVKIRAGGVAGDWDHYFPIRQVL
jgi:hypothetical protein